MLLEHQENVLLVVCVAENLGNLEIEGILGNIFNYPGRKP